MAKIVLPQVAGGFDTATMNANFQKIAAQMNEQVLYRDVPTNEDNRMKNNLDMNSNRIYNLPQPVKNHEPARLQDIGDAPGYAEEAKEWAEKAEEIYNKFWLLMGQGFSYIGLYEQGVEVNDVFDIFYNPDTQMFYRPDVSLSLPYTITGDWETEKDLFVPVNDIALREELSKENGASLVGYGDGTLKEAVDALVETDSYVVTVEKHGAKCDGVTDDSSAFISAALEAKEKGLPLIGLGGGKGYLIKTPFNMFTEVDIKAPIIFPADGVSRYIQVMTDKAPTLLPFSSLTGLTHGSMRIGGLPANSGGKFLHITSTEVLTERNDGPGADPYYKNCAVYISDDTGSISPYLDATFNTGHSVSVKLFEKESRMDVKIHSVVFEGDGESIGGIRILRDSTDLYVGGFSAKDTVNRTHITVVANDCNIHPTTLDDANYPGYGYGINIGLSCKTTINGVKGATARTEIDGRHGSLVTVRDSFVKTAGSHWGNTYVFDNCHIERYSYNGLNLKITGGSFSYINIRNDVGYCEGRLEVKDVTWKVKDSNSAIVPSGPIISGFYSTPRRFFDEIEINSLHIEGGYGKNLTLIGGGATANYDAIFAIPRLVRVSNVTGAEINGLLNIYGIPFSNARNYSQASDYTFENIVIHPQGRIEQVTNAYLNTSAAAVNWKFRNCGRINLRLSANTIESLRVEDSTVLGFGRPDASTAKGAIELVNCKYAPITFSYTESAKIFKNVEFIGDVTVGQGSDGRLLYQVGCVAKKGATGYRTPLNYWVNTDFYE